MSVVAIFPSSTQRVISSGRVRQTATAVGGHVARVISNWRARRALQPVPDYLLDDVGMSRGRADQIRARGRNSFDSCAVPGHSFY